LINYIISITKNKKNFANEFLAILYLNIDKKEEALDIFEETVNKNLTDFDFIHMEPSFDSLHSEPRFIELLERMGQKMTIP